MRVITMLLDARLRFSISEFHELHLTHLYSDIESPWHPDGAQLLIHGFTEWTAASVRVLTFGWDWTFNPTLALFHANWDSLRTNVIVLGAAGRETDSTWTRKCVAERMTECHWTSNVEQALGEKLRAAR